MITFVGSVQNHSATSPLTLNYNTGGGGTTGGNCLVACITAWATSPGASVTGITLGGTADNWQAATGGSKASLWIDPACAGGQTAIQVSAATTGTDLMINVFVMEFSGIAAVSPVDQVSSAGGTFGSFSSGTTGTTAFAAEAWVGIGTGDSTSTFTISGPGSPWTNLSAISNSSGSEFTRSIAGYQVTTATGAASYAGSFSPSASQNGVAAVLTLAPALTTRPSLIIPGPQPVRRAAFW